MSKMSEIDTELREAGIDTETVDLDNDGGFIIPEGSGAYNELMELLARSKIYPKHEE